MPRVSKKKARQLAAKKSKAEKEKKEDDVSVPAIAEGEEGRKKAASSVKKKTVSSSSGSGAGAGAGAGAEDEPKTAMDKAVEGATITFAAPKKMHRNTRDIAVDNINVGLFGKELLVETSLRLNWGNRYGLIGANGCGKSILMTMIGRRLLPLPGNIDCFHVVSEIDPSELSALEAVLEVDSEKKALELEAEELSEMMATLEDEEADECSDRMSEIYERLDELDAATAESRAARILHGLGFTVEMQAKKTRDFSGGWRMRIALARALFLNPSLLLLDEPTNHLDMEAVVWLEDYLARFNKILFMVSHSQDFMNNVCTHIINFTEKQLKLYGGNFDTFIRTRREKEEAQMKQYNWEQDQIKNMKNYIAKFGHGSAKLARQAQSKEKTLAKMERAGLTAKVTTDRALKMRFPDPGTIPPPVLQIQSVCFNYPGGPQLYKDVDYGVDLDSRVALVGPNGAGKSTLLKLIAGELVPTSGNIRPHPHLRIARYTQHFVDQLDLEREPLEFFMQKSGETNPEKMRGFLGKFGLTGEQQTTKMEFLSDGLKSRVVFAMMAEQTPHILMLDEPTNHLDIETIDSLADAINHFEGGVLLVSHDMRLISQVAKEVWECKDRTITRFDGDISSYKDKLKVELARAALEFEKERTK